MCPKLTINGPPFLTAAANVFASAPSCTNAGSLQIRADFAIDFQYADNYIGAGLYCTPKY